MSDKIMDRVQALINKANGTDNEHERRIYQAKAEELMHSHKIDQAMLRMRNASKTAAEPSRTRPIDEKIEWVSEFDEFRDIHASMVGHLGRLAGIMIVNLGSHLHLIGYPDDIAYFRMLWVSTHLTFSGKLFPEWDRNLPAHRQIRAFIEAGYKWDFVWDMAVRQGQPFTRISKGEEIRVPRPPADNGWMKRQLQKAYDETGEEKPKLTHGVRVYRDSYAQAFADIVNQRADDMWFGRRQRENEAGSGVGLVLKKDADELKDYYESLYPPGTTKSNGARRRFAGTHAGAAARGRAAGQSVDFSAGQGGVAGAKRQEIG